MEFNHYINGQWQPTTKATISVFDVTVLRGYGIFDYLRTYNRKPFTLSQHIDRLFRSASYLGLEIPKTKEEIMNLIRQGVDKNPDAKDLDIRIVVTGGVGPTSITPGTPSLLILFGEASAYPEDHYTNGVSISTESMIRQLPQAKTLNYLMAIPALSRARSTGAIEVVYVGEDGSMYEGTTSNFFAVIDNTIVTPKDDILIGITRTLVIDLAKKLSIPLQERKLLLSELPTFTEAFITASNKEIMPVTRINDTLVGNGTVGPITQSLRKEYEELKKNISK